MTKVELTYDNFNRLVLVKINGTVVHEIDMSPKPYWQVCWSQGWSGEYASEEDANDYCFSVCGFYRSVREVKPSDQEYVNPDNLVLRTRTFFSKNNKQPLELIK